MAHATEAHAAQRDSHSRPGALPGRACARAALAMLVVLTAGQAWGKELVIRHSRQLQTVLRTVRPGTTLRIDPGTYTGGIYLRGVSGTKEAPIVIAGARPDKPPVFTGGGSEGMHLSDCN